MDKLNKLVDELSELSVLEMAELKKLLEDKWGVKAAAAAPVMMAAAGGAAAAAPAAAAESTEFEVTLKEVPADKKIGAIKVIRELTNLGLKEAKDFVDAAPKVVKPNATKNEAEEMQKKLTEAGCKVEVKGV